MPNKNITNFEAICFLVLLSIAGIVLSANKIIVQDCQSASILNSLFITFLSFVGVSILSILSKNFNGQNLLDISYFLGGKIVKNVVGIIFILYITFRISLFLRIISTTLQTVYYPMTHIIFIVALFCLTAAIICNLKSESLFKANVFITCIIFIAMVLIFIGNTKNYHYENIYPILGNGIKATFFSGASNIFAICTIAYLFFLPSKLKNPEQFSKIAFISVGLSGLFLILCTANTLFLFSDTLTNSEIFPLYLSVRYIEFGTFFQRLDSIFLFLCVIGFISLLCFNTYILTSIIKDITEVSDDKPLILPSLFTIFDLSLIIRKHSTIRLFDNNIAKILYIITAFILPFSILILANIKKKVIQKKFK